MKNFEYASKEKKHFSIPRIKYEDYDIIIFALPIAPFFIAYDKIKEWAYQREQWNEEKASKILDCFLPYALEYNKTDDIYYYCYGWHYNGFDLARHAPITLKLFAKKFSYRIFRYLVTDYEKTGFIKAVEEENYDRYDTWVKFVKIF